MTDPLRVFGVHLAHPTDEIQVHPSNRSAVVEALVLLDAWRVRPNPFVSPHDVILLGEATRLERAVALGVEGIAAYAAGRKCGLEFRWAEAFASFDARGPFKIDHYCGPLE